MKVLIIGCGKLGTRLAEILNAEGHQIWALKRHPEHLPSFINPLQGDLSYPPEIEWTVFDLIYVVISPDQRDRLAYQELYEVKFPALVRILRNQLKPSQTIIFVSSTHIYSENQGNWINHKTEARAYDYRSQALLTAEKSLLDSNKLIRIVRFSGLYDQNATFIFNQLQAGKLENAGDYSNRIHREDAARFLAYLTTYSGNETEFLASDNEPVKKGVLISWLADQCGLPQPQFEKNQISGKRCDNRSMLDSGFVLVYPNYQAGYRTLIEQFKAQKA